MAWADISLTPEFYDALGPSESSDFEAEGYWTTNNGGGLSQNYWVEGSHSWYTAGGGDYYMWRYVDGSRISAIAGKTIMFSFRFYPESVVTDGTQNNARAEIYYEYTTGGGGGPGGYCPFVSVWDGGSYVHDNNVLPRSVLSGGVDVEDFYRLEQTPVRENGKYMLLLSEFASDHSYLDKVNLLAVDHESEVNIAVTSGGEILTYKNPTAPISAVDKDGNDTLSEISLIDGNVSDPATYFQGFPNDYLVLNFGKVKSDNAKLILRDDMKKMDDPCILVQVKNGSGAWQTVDTLVPRAYWSMEAANLSPYVVKGQDLWVRLYWQQPHRLDYVGLDTSKQAKINLQQGELVSAVHSKNGDPTVPGAYMGDGDVKSKLLRDDGIYSQLSPSEQIELAFALPEVSSDFIRDFILVSKGSYSTLPPETLIDPTVFGVWVAPTELEWYNAYVTAYLPTTTTAVKVIIHGTPDFRAYVDVATLTIFDYATAPPSPYGKLTLGVNLYEWRKTTGFPPDGEVKLTPALYAEVSSGSYGIRAVQIKVELLPNDGSSTSQDGVLNAEYVSQGNDEGYEIDPAVTEEVQTENLEIAGIIISFGTGILMGFGVPLIFGEAAGSAIGIFARTSTSTVITKGAAYLLKSFASDPNDPHAQKGGDYFALEYWNYPDLINEEFVGPQPWFVASASGQYSMIWGFETGTADNFQIKITASVNWGEIVYHPRNIHDYWTLDDRGWSEVSRIITICA